MEPQVQSNNPNIFTSIFRTFTRTITAPLRVSESLGTDIGELLYPGNTPGYRPPHQRFPLNTPLIRGITNPSNRYLH